MERCHVMMKPTKSQNRGAEKNWDVYDHILDELYQRHVEQTLEEDDTLTEQQECY